jgi:hypothetical protein
MDSFTAAASTAHNKITRVNSLSGAISVCMAATLIVILLCEDAHEISTAAKYKPEPSSTREQRVT